MAKLTKKNEVFCEEYLIDLNATQAAIRAGYSVDSAGSIGSELLKKPEIRARIDKAMRDYLDKTVHNANVDTAADEFTTFHGVRVYSSVFLPAKTKAVIMIDGAIAQPAVIYPYKEPEKIPLSNDYGVSMFYDYGTKVLTPDLVFHMTDGE